VIGDLLVAWRVEDGTAADHTPPGWSATTPPTVMGGRYPRVPEPDPSIAPTFTTPSVIERAERVARDPAAASDSDKLRTVADYLDRVDARLGNTGDAVQRFLRDLAARLDPSRGRVTWTQVMRLQHQVGPVSLMYGDVYLEVTDDARVRARLHLDGAPVDLPGVMRVFDEPPVPDVLRMGAPVIDDYDYEEYDES
jgi:hypothetical protein